MWQFYFLYALLYNLLTDELTRDDANLCAV
jgi:hypothetical protein